MRQSPLHCGHVVCWDGLALAVPRTSRRECSGKPREREKAVDQEVPTRLTRSFSNSDLGCDLHEQGELVPFNTTVPNSKGRFLASPSDTEWIFLCAELSFRSFVIFSDSAPTCQWPYRESPCDSQYLAGQITPLPQRVSLWWPLPVVSYLDTPMALPLTLLV